jgi:hypothetical protein
VDLVVEQLVVAVHRRSIPRPARRAPGSENRSTDKMRRGLGQDKPRTRRGGRPESTIAPVTARQVLPYKKHVALTGDVPVAPGLGQGEVMVHCNNGVLTLDRWEDICIRTAAPAAAARCRDRGSRTAGAAAFARPAAGPV